VQAVARLVPSVGLEFIEFGVLFVFDLGFAAQPEGVDGVDLLTVEVDWEWNETGVAFDDLLDG
jgi:hypothetical protein